MNNYYTYELCSSETPTIPFYIGKGKGKRIHEHEKKALKEKHNNKHLQNKILKIWKDGNTIIKRKIIESIPAETKIPACKGRL